MVAATDMASVALADGRRWLSADLGLIDWDLVDWDLVDWDLVDWDLVNWGLVDWDLVNWGLVDASASRGQMQSHTRFI